MEIANFRFDRCFLQILGDVIFKSCTVISTTFSLFSNVSSALNSTGNGTSSEEEEVVGCQHGDQHVGDQHGDDQHVVTIMILLLNMVVYHHDGQLMWWGWLR